MYVYMYDVCMHLRMYVFTRSNTVRTVRTSPRIGTSASDSESELPVCRAHILALYVHVLLTSKKLTHAAP